MRRFGNCRCALAVVWYDLLILLAGSNICAGVCGNIDTTLKVIKADSIITLVTDGKPVDFDRHLIQGPLKLENSKIKGKFTLVSCTFMDAVCINKCDFDTAVTLIIKNSCMRQDFLVTECNINNSAYFDNDTCAGAMEFNGTTFYGPASFKAVNCGGGVGFNAATFEDTAYFVSANFLNEITFRGAKFNGYADFRYVRFCGIADFSMSAFLGGRGENCFADQRHSGTFSGATLDSGSFYKADISNVVFSPESLGAFTMGHMIRAEGLDKLFQDDRPEQIARLKTYFRDNCARQREREITCAINRQEQGFLKKALFDCPFKYGASLSRPFLFVAGIYILATVLYYILLRFLRRGGMIFFGKEIVMLNGEARRESETINEYIEKVARLPIWRRERLGGEIKIIIMILTFSLISTFNLGFRDYDFARWLRLMWFHNVEFKADGAVRLIAGVQSLLSVLLMVLGLLFYYGRFFD